MHSKTALLLLALIGASLAAVTSGDIKTTANTEKEQTLGGGALSGFDSRLKATLPSVKVKTTNDATISISITSLDLTSIIGGLLGGVGASFAGGIAPDSASLFVNFNTTAFADTLSTLKQGISLTVTSDVDTTVTLKINTGSFAASGDGIDAKTGLFLGTNDASISSSATIYGAVPYSISADNKEYTYTFPVKKGDTKLYMKPFDLNKTKNGNNASGSQSNGGSSSFNFNAAFLPVAYNTKFDLQSGYQYAFGNNIRVTPSGSSAGDLTVQNEGAFSTSSTKSAGPAGASYYLDGSFHFTSSNNGQNIIQYVAKKTDQTRFFFNGTVGASVDTIGTAKGKALTWYRAAGDAGASVAANAWTKVSSTSNYDANGNLVVYAQVSSYSHWTVGSSDGAAAGLQVTIATVLLATLLALAL